TWHDALGRVQATADYGTNGGSTLSRPSTIPARTDSVLITSLTYDNAGNRADMRNPGGVLTCYDFDHRGRELVRIMNCTTSSSSSSSSSGFPASIDTDITVQTVYNADGYVSSITAVNALTGNQTTEFV